MKELKKTAIAVGAAQVVWMASGEAFAQTAPAANSGNTNSVVVVGQRAALESAAQVKKNYKVTDNMSAAFEARNLNDAIYKQYVQQGIGLMEKGSYYTVRSYTLQASYSF